MTTAGSSDERASTRHKEEDVYDYQIGLEDVDLPVAEKHFFDIAGYVVLKDLLSPSEVDVARKSSLAALAERDIGDGEVVHVIERGGVLEDAMALPPVIERVKQFIWGRQHRLVGSRVIVRGSGESSTLIQGGAADPRRYARYRCFGDGQFRCLLLTCLIALQDTTAADGALCVLPSSHKANLPHPYADVPLNKIEALRDVELRAGSGVLLTENLSRAMSPYASGSNSKPHVWLAYHYGTSYMVNWPGCDASDELIERCASDEAKSHLLLPPYYHPAGAQLRGVINAD
ncbi:MAG: phytanoyl-CoA dioxygenase family protein [Planctomycetes bacterium]|nr:phytanoyl-CoA dioxygenase family protein [Planctomycetota bacterium]